MSKMAKHSWILICFVCFIVVSMVIADRNQVTSTSGSVGTEVEGKQVVPAKRYLDDKFPDLGQDLCLDCCGAHPCCHDCGLGDLFGHHGHLPTAGTTMEPHSPEKDETYGQSGHTGIHFPDTDLGPLHLGPDGDLGHHPFVPLVDSGEHTGGFLPHTDLEKPYWKVLGKKK